MAKEIERKFLFKKEFLTHAMMVQSGMAEIKQGYLTNPMDEESKACVRVRISDQKAVVTIKSRGLEVRDEFEYPIPISEAEDMLNSVVRSKVIEKQRWVFSLGGGLVCELDVFKGELEGLIVAEVEFSCEEEAEKFAPPEWFGKEVTTDPKFTNAQLAFNGWVK